MATYYFMTNAPAIKKLRVGEFEELHILGLGLSGTLQGKLRVNLKAGTSTTHSTGAVTMVGNKVVFLVRQPVEEMDWTAISSFNAWLEYNSVVVTEVRTFIPDLTARRDCIRMGWLNLIGGTDYFTFYGTHRGEATADRTTFIRELPSPFAKSDRGEGVLASMYSEEFEAVSDFITPDEIVWLSEILSSPEVWISKQGVNIPIVITATGHTVKIETMIQMRIKYRMANERISQNG